MIIWGSMCPRNGKGEQKDGKEGIQQVTHLTAARQKENFLNPISNLKETRFHFPNVLGHSKHRHSHCSEELATRKLFRYEMF